MRNKIYLNEWLYLKPYNKQVSTDFYYLKICNEIWETFLSLPPDIRFSFPFFMDEDEFHLLSCFLTSYFEDLVSGTNIWNAFVKKHQELYQKPLPFYNVEEYYEEEINTQDIIFLIWYFLNSVQHEKFISPYNDFIEKVAFRIMEIFEREWEYAPENEHIRSYYQIDEDEDDFYVARYLMGTIFLKTYLFHTDTFLTIVNGEEKLMDEYKEDDNLLMFVKEFRDDIVHNTHTQLLALRSSEWAALIIGNDHLLHKKFNELSLRITSFFLYKGQDDENVFIEHIASGKKFNLTKKSYDHGDSLKEIDTILYISIVKWDGEWWFSGLQFIQPFNADLILDQKNSLNSRKTVDFLDYKTKEMQNTLELQYKAFLEFNNGQPIAFLPTDKMEAFINNYIEYFNESLQLSEKQKKDAIQRLKNEGFLNPETSLIDFSEKGQTGLVFFNPKTGLEMAFDVNAAFSLPFNPYFNAEKSKESLFILFMDESFSKELVMYCIDHSKNDLPFFQTAEGKMFLNNIDFLLQFWKKGNYYSKPSITLTGQKE